MKKSIPQIADSLRNSRESLDKNAYEEFQHVDFWVYNFDHFSDTYNEELMIRARHIIENFDPDVWLAIASKIKRDPYNLLSLYLFFYRYVGVDLLEHAKISNRITEETYRDVIQYMKARPGLICHSKSQQFALKMHGITMQHFEIMKKKLVAKGVPLFEIRYS